VLSIVRVMAFSSGFLVLLAIWLVGSTATTGPIAIVASANFVATAIVTVDPATGIGYNQVDLPENVTAAAVFPDCFAQHGDLAVLCLFQECLYFFSLSGGTLTNMYCSTELVIDNVGAFEPNTGMLVFSAYNMTSSRNFVYRIRYDNPTTVTVVVPLPGIVQVAINAYSSKNRFYFLTLQDRDAANNNLLVIDMGANKVLYNVSVSQSIEMLTFDDSTNRLFVWYATEGKKSSVCLYLCKNTERTTHSLGGCIICVRLQNRNGSTSSLYQSYPLGQWCHLYLSFSHQYHVCATIGHQQQ
jgi:hypothetical protein